MTFSVGFWHEAVLNKNGLGRGAKKHGEEIETLFDRLIFDNQDASSSQMLLLIAHQVREVLSPGKTLQYPV
jgi:sigma-54 dependent transcriptional regulator of gfr operon